MQDPRLPSDLLIKRTGDPQGHIVGRINLVLQAIQFAVFTSSRSAYDIQFIPFLTGTLSSMRFNAKGTFYALRRTFFWELVRIVVLFTLNKISLLNVIWFTPVMTFRGSKTDSENW